jgi:hypothetical protein
LIGGDTIYLQQQQYSIQALHERDQDQPFAKPVAGAGGAPAASTSDNAANDSEADEDDAQDEERGLRELAEIIIKGLQEAAA